MTKQSLLALADRVEMAEGGNIALAAEIHCAVRGYTIHEETDPATGHFAFWEGEPWKSPCINCSSWSDPTASIDEAAQLVPEGWRVEQLGEQPHPKQARRPWWCILRPRDIVANRRSGGWDQHASLDCVSPALALTSASLRAVAETM